MESMLERLSTKDLRRLLRNRDYAVDLTRYQRYIEQDKPKPNQDIVELLSRRRLVIDYQRWKIQAVLERRT